MTPIVHPNEADERPPSVEREQRPGELPRTAPLIPPKGAIEAREAREATPTGVPLAAPPTPPRPPLPAQPRRGPSGWRWALGIGLAILGGLSWFPLGFAVAYVVNTGAGDLSTLGALLVAALPAVTCLVAGWLLRSWWGLAAAAVVFVAVSALSWVLFVGGGPAGMAFLTIEFVLFVVVPAIVMSTIGTVLGIYTTGRRE